MFLDAQSLRIYEAGRKVDLNSELKYELMPVPVALGEMKGTLRAEQKSVSRLNYKWNKLPKCNRASRQLKAAQVYYYMASVCSRLAKCSFTPGHYSPVVPTGRLRIMQVRKGKTRKVISKARPYLLYLH